MLEVLACSCAWRNSLDSCRYSDRRWTDRSMEGWMAGMGGGIEHWRWVVARVAFDPSIHRSTGHGIRVCVRVVACLCTEASRPLALLLRSATTTTRRMHHVSECMDWIRLHCIMRASKRARVVVAYVRRGGPMRPFRGALENAQSTAMSLPMNLEPLAPSMAACASSAVSYSTSA